MWPVFVYSIEKSLRFILLLTIAHAISSMINVINSMTVKLNHTPLIPASFADNATMIRGRIYPRRITMAIEMYELLMAEKKILKTTLRLENIKLINNNFIPEFAKAITLKFDAALKKSIIR